MTKQDIINEVRDELADNGVTYYSTDDLLQAYDDGYQEICLLSKCLERYGEFTIRDEGVYYNLYEEFSDYYAPFAIFNRGTDDWLSHKDMLFFQKQRSDWELQNGPSVYFSKIDFQFICVFPRKVLGEDIVFEVYYHGAPTVPLETQSTPEIPSQYQKVINFYMMEDLLAQAEEFTKASMFGGLYMVELEKLKEYVNNRTLSDRVDVLRAMFSGGSFYGR